jgi:hypothetical protein
MPRIPVRKVCGVDGHIRKPNGIAGERLLLSDTQGYTTEYTSPVMCCSDGLSVDCAFGRCGI